MIYFDEIENALKATDAAVATQIRTGVYEPRTALAVLSEARERLSQLSPALRERLTIHATEAAAQAAVTMGWLVQTPAGGEG